MPQYLDSYETESSLATDKLLTVIQHPSGDHTRRTHRMGVQKPIDSAKASTRHYVALLVDIGKIVSVGQRHGEFATRQLSRNAEDSKARLL